MRAELAKLSPSFRLFLRTVPFFGEVEGFTGFKTLPETF